MYWKPPLSRCDPNIYLPLFALFSLIFGAKCLKANLTLGSPKKSSVAQCHQFCLSNRNKLQLPYEMQLQWTVIFFSVDPGRLTPPRASWSTAVSLFLWTMVVFTNSTQRQSTLWSSTTACQDSKGTAPSRGCAWRTDTGREWSPHVRNLDPS